MSKAFTWSVPEIHPIQSWIAGDDYLWMAPCSHDNLVSLVQDPYQWIDTYNAQQGSDIELAEYFVMQVGLVDRVAKAGAARKLEASVAEFAIPWVDQADYIVHGISGTPVITIRPNLAVQPLSESWDSYWREWGDYTQTQLDVGIAGRQGFGHLQIANSTVSASEKADRIAAFLLIAGDPSYLYNGTTYYINMILALQASNVKTLLADGTLRDTPLPAGGYLPRQFRDLTADQIRQVNFMYTGRQEDMPDDEEDAEDAERAEAATGIAACDDMSGAIGNDNLILLDTVVVKSYPPEP